MCERTQPQSPQKDLSSTLLQPGKEISHFMLATEHASVKKKKEGVGGSGEGNGDCYFNQQRKLLVHHILYSPGLDRFSLAIKASCLELILPSLLCSQM